MALAGEQLVGPYSRFEFNHPGPFYFYLLAPLYWITHYNTSSLTVTVIVMNALLLIGMLIIIGRCTNRWTYVWFAFLLSQYVHYLGSKLQAIWNPYVTILPFLFSIWCFAAVAAGRLGYLPLAILTSSFVIQTHLGYSLTIVTIGISSGALFAVPRLRHVLGMHTTRSNALKITIVCTIVFTVLWILPVIEQLSESPGNFSRIITFFTEHHGQHPWSNVFQVSNGIFSDYFLSYWSFLLNKLISRLPDNSVPRAFGMTQFVIMLGQEILVMSAYFYAKRKNQDYFVALSLLCGIAYVTMVFSIKGIIDPFHDYIVMWMTSLGVINWIVIGDVLLHPVERKIRVLLGKRLQWLIIVFVMGIYLRTTFKCDGI
jgi:hypothetical protein